MKVLTLQVALAIMLAIGMSYLAGIWRNEGINIAKDLEGKGENERSQLIADGGVDAARIAAEFRGKGIEESGRIEGAATTQAHTIVSGGEVDKVKESRPDSETLDIVTDALQGFKSLVGNFRSLANSNRSDAERDILIRVSYLAEAAGESLSKQGSAIRGVGLFTDCDPGVESAVKAFEYFSSVRSRLDEEPGSGFRPSAGSGQLPNPGANGGRKEPMLPERSRFADVLEPEPKKKK